MTGQELTRNIAYLEVWAIQAGDYRIGEAVEFVERALEDPASAFMGDADLSPRHAMNFTEFSAALKRVDMRAWFQGTEGTRGAANEHG